MTAIASRAAASAPRPRRGPPPIPLTAGHRGRAAQDVRHPLRLLADGQHRASPRVLATGAVILFAPDGELTYDTFAAAIGFPMAIILPMIAILSVTSEWSQRSGLTTFTLVPHRGRVIARQGDRLGRRSASSSMLRRLRGRRARQPARHRDHRHRPGLGRRPSTDLAYIVLGNVLGLLIGFMLGVLIRNSAGRDRGLLRLLVRAAHRCSALLAASQQLVPRPAALGGLQLRPGRAVRRRADRRASGRTSPSPALIWLLVPLAVGLVLVMRSEVK